MALSGGADSVRLLLHALELRRREGVVVEALHVNHGARGAESEEDQRFVESLCRSLSVPLRVGRLHPEGAAPPRAAGFEERARRGRYRLLEEMAREGGLDRVLVGHTSDDQAETVLMRLFEGSGVGGIKGIPEARGELFRRPLAGISRETVEAELSASGTPYRTDSSNRDLSFERNWLRHVLLPLLESRYGPSAKRRLLSLGERFREVDAYLEVQADGWIRRHCAAAPGEEAGWEFGRDPYRALPSLLRIRILQRLLRSLGGREPGERSLVAADRLLLDGPPSGSADAGGGRAVRNRYGTGRIVREPSWRSRPSAPGGDAPPSPLPLPGRTAWGGAVPVTVAASLEDRPAETPPTVDDPASARFDLEGVRLPLSLSPVRRGDRILLPGGRGRRKVQDLFTDRKVPREQRWGRCAVVDGDGEILWIPGVARSGIAPPGPPGRPVLSLGTAPGEDVIK